MTTRATRIWIVALAVVISLGIGLFVVFIGWAGGGRVVVLNQARLPVQELRIDAAGQVLEARGLDPGESRSFPLRPHRDGSFSVTGRFASGRRVHGLSLGYTTNGDTAEHRLRIQENGAVLYESAVRGVFGLP